MKWVAISGSWRNTTEKIESDVRRHIKDILSQDKGIISGGALGVDWIATDEAIKLNPKMDKIKIFLPTSFETYRKYYLEKANEGIISKAQAESLSSQLLKIKNTNRKALIEGEEEKVNQESYFKRISKIVDNADSLVAFRVNKSKGATYTIEKAKKKGIPIKVYDYEI